MWSRYAFLLVGLLACSRAGGPETEVTSTTSPPPVMKPAPAPPPAPPPKTPPPAAPQVTVDMTAATLADRCGDSPPMSPPPAAAPAAGPRAKEARSQEREESDARGAGMRGDRGRLAREDARGDMACEQTSMQLSVTSPAGAAPVQLTVKKVELYDENGKLLGELASRSPTVWDASAYKPWDQKVATGAQLSVSYLLAPPDWGAIGGRHSKMYTLKAIVAVGGADQTLSREVQVMGITTLPPNVRT